MNTPSHVELIDLACGELQRRGLRVVRFNPDLYGQPWRPTLYVVPIDCQEDLSNDTIPSTDAHLSTSTDNTTNLQKENDEMARKKDMFPSKYLKQDDVADEITVTIKRMKPDTVGIGDDAADKPILHFAEPHVKPMVLNGGNWDVLEGAYGDSDDWGGKRVIIWRDPTVRYGSKTVGGLRVRIPTAKKQTATPAAPPLPEELPDLDYEDEIVLEAD